METTNLTSFAQDLQHIDRDLPAAVSRFLTGETRRIHRVRTKLQLTRCTAACNCVAAAILICIGATYLAAMVPVFCACLYILQKYYLRTSRQLRLLEIEARSPLYSHFQETADGVATIRAFGWQHELQNYCFELVDESQKPYYLLFCIQRWLILILGFMTAASAILLVSFAITLPKMSSSGSVGVGLIAVLGFGDSLNLLILSWTSLETSLGAIMRTKTFCATTTPEDGANMTDPLSDEWPTNAVIHFKGARASYRQVKSATSATSATIFGSNRTVDLIFLQLSMTSHSQFTKAKN
jgi:ATP-binding cassette subfamily C (CFTR/MRP) protein 1